MSKPSPFFKNEKERQELVQRISSFQFADPEESSKLVVLIAGKEGSGKTHLACTMNDLGNVYVIDTEYRAQMVTRKFNGIRHCLVRNFSDMVVAVKHILMKEDPGTIVIDSGSDLQTYAEIGFLERTEKESVGMPWNWSEVWRLCNAIIDEIKFSRRFHLVVTARLKEEFANDKGTGIMVPRIYSTLPYKADIAIQFDTVKGRKPKLTKNGFSGDISPVIDGLSLPEIISVLSANPQQAPSGNGRQKLIAVH